jgi:hypothetical protein
MRTHELAPEANRELVSNAADSLTSGGWLVVIDQLRGRSDHATATTVERLATGECGEAYDAGSYREWFSDAGLRAVQVRDIPGTNRQAVLGQTRVS